MVAHVATKDTDKEQLAELMVGRKVRLKVDKGPTQPGDAKLKVDGLSYVDDAKVERVKSVSFEVRAGEVVGIAGVSGNGQSELLSLLGGILKPSKGSFTITGGGQAHEVSVSHPADPERVRNFGLGHVPEDRHKMGLINRFEAKEAFILGYHRRPSTTRAGCRTRRRSCRIARPRWTSGRAPAPSRAQDRQLLRRQPAEAGDRPGSGAGPGRAADRPADPRGRHRRHRVHPPADHRHARQGQAVLLVSVELDEIMSLSDRILVIADGRIVGELDAAKADERTIGLMMANIVPDDVAASQSQGATS